MSFIFHSDCEFEREPKRRRRADQVWLKIDQFESPHAAEEAVQVKKI